MRYKIGMRFKSKTSNVIIELTSKHNGSGHWNSKKIGGSNKNHRIFEGTLEKFYEPISLQQ